MEKAILQQLELRRQKMIDCGLQYGFQNEKTIRHSRQLDRLINLYEQQQQQGIALLDQAAVKKYL